MKKCFFYLIVVFTTLTQTHLHAQRDAQPTIIVRFDNERFPTERQNAFRRLCEERFHIHEIEQFQTCDGKLTFCLWEIPNIYIIDAIGVINDQQGAGGCRMPTPSFLNGQNPSNVSNHERVDLREAYSTLSEDLFSNISGNDCEVRPLDRERFIHILDSGLDDGGQSAASGNPLFSNNTFLGQNYIDKNAKSIDDFWHGTHVVGIMEMFLDKHPAPIQIGMSKVLDKNGKGNLFNVLHAISNAMCETQVFNFSFSYKIPRTELSKPKDFLTDLMAHAGQNFGCLFVVGSGNDGEDLQNTRRTTHIMPAEAELENMIAVYSIDGQGDLSAKSNYGKQSKTLRIGAMGEKVLSATLKGQWLRASGTSMAAPSVAAVAGIVSTYQNGTNGYQSIMDIINQSKQQTGGRMPSGAPVEILNFCKAIDLAQSARPDYLAASTASTSAVSTAMSATPNPSNGLLNLSFQGLELGEGVVSVFDLHGTQVATQSISVQKGQNTQALNVQNLPLGLYQIVLYLGKETKTVRVLKQ